MGVAEELYIFLRESNWEVRPLCSFEDTFGHNGVDLSEIVFLCLLFSNSRDEPPEMGMIMPKVGKGLGLLCCWFEFSCLGGSPGGSGGSSSKGLWF